MPFHFLHGWNVGLRSGGEPVKAHSSTFRQRRPTFPRIRRHGGIRMKLPYLPFFFRDRFDSETNWQCRVKMDDFLLQTDPDWKASDERLAFLERSLELCRTVATSNAILETIQDRLIPVDVEAYERHMRMIRW